MMNKQASSSTSLVVHKLDETTNPIGVLGEVERLLGEVAEGEARLDVNWIRLGTLLESVQVHEYWRGKFKSFGAYLKEIVGKYTIKRSQLYNYIATAHTLRPFLSEEQLAQIGIAKARALTDGFKTFGSLPSLAIETALDSGKTTENVKEALFKGTNVEIAGAWFPLTGFMVSADEKATLDLAFETARRTDPAPPKEWKSWQVMKDSLLKMAMEFISSHPEVETFGEETEF